MAEILDIGCGKNKTPGAVGIDISTESDADVIQDLESFPYPFADNAFDGAVSKQVFEHMENPFKVLDEVYRVLKPGASIIIEVPHFTCHYAFRSLHHKHFFSYFSLDTYLKKYKKFTYKKRKITFHKYYRWFGISLLANKFPLGYERFFAFTFPAEHIHLELEVTKNS